jgi:prepilin-type N-terminal cleavage/methylation domain-containing protein
MYSSTQKNGFTLTELLVVMSIVAILLVIAGPNLSDYNANNRINGATQEFQNIIQLARTEAITGNVTVNIDSANGDDWSGDISICTVNVITTSCTESGATLIKTYNLGTNKVAINSNSTGDPLISFNSQGRLAEAPGSTVTLAFCDARPDGNRDYRLIIITPTGRSRVSDLGGGTCTPA